MELCEHRAVPHGKVPAPVFFGYANCKGICSVALPRMSEAVKTAWRRKSNIVTPVLITVDPERDTVDNMKPGSSGTCIHVWSGLTGTVKMHSAVAYKAFQVENKIAYVDPKEGPGVFTRLVHLPVGAGWKVQNTVPADSRARNAWRRSCLNYIEEGQKK